MRSPFFDLLDRFDLSKDQIAIVTERSEITYGRLRQAVLASAGYLLHTGVTRSSFVCVAIRHPIHSLVSYLAVGLIGARWVAENRVETLASLGVTHILFDNGIDTSGFNQREQRFHHLPFGHLAESELAGYIGKMCSIVSPQDTWAVIGTSGTTGAPKFVALSYHNFARRMAGVHTTHDINPVITANWMPAGSWGWANYSFRTFAASGVCVISSKLDFLSRRGVQKVFGSPAMFARLLPKEATSLSHRLSLAHIGGSVLTDDLTRKVLAFFNEIDIYYGATEVSGIAHRILETTEDLSCVGQAFDGVQLEIVDETGCLLPRFSEGRVRVRSNCMVSGYLNNEEATRNSFRDGWFYSGDMGYFDDKKRLHLTGRLDDVLNIGGVKIDPKITDRALQACSSVSEVLSFKGIASGRDVLLAMIVPKKGMSQEFVEFEALEAMKSIEARYRARKLVFTDKLPRNENGKLSRSLASKIYVDHVGSSLN